MYIDFETARAILHYIIRVLYTKGIRNFATLTNWWGHPINAAVKEKELGDGIRTARGDGGAKNLLTDIDF